MPRRLNLSLVLALLALALLPAVASASWFPAQPVDGPSPDVEKLGGVDLARDGSGGLVYLKRVGGVPHVFLSRFNGGQFRAPEQVDTGIPAGAGEAAVAAGDANRLAVVWTAGNSVYGSVVNGGAGAPGPLLGPTQLSAAPGIPSDVSVDMGANGVAYTSYAVPGPGISDVRVSRLEGTTWTPVGAPLDIDPARSAGRGSQRSDVSVSAEGNGLVAWGEDHADGRPRVYARRVIGLSPSAFPQELSLGDLGGQPGGRADSADISVEDDSGFAWAVFRQDFGGGSRAIARRMLGSTFDPAVPLDAGPGTTAPRLAMNGRGQGLAVLEIPGGGVGGSFLYNDLFEGGQPLHSAASTEGAGPQAGASDHHEVAVAWRVVDPAGNVSIRGRMKPEPAKPFEPEAELSRPDLGPVAAGQYAVSADRVAGFAVAMVQGAPGSRTVAAAVRDRPPGRPSAIAPRVSRSGWLTKARPTLRWRAGTDLWGPQRFRVLVGGRVVGETTGTSLTRPVIAGRPLPYQVVAIDARGQEAPSRARIVRFDNQGPHLSIEVTGRLKARRPLRITVRASDGGGSGVRTLRVRYGDSRQVMTRRGRRFRGRHAYRRGRHALRVTGYDKLGNRRVEVVRLRIS